MRVRPEDLRKFGLIPEFIGRLPVIATVQALGQEDLVRVMTEPKNSLISQYKYLLSLDGVELEISDDAVAEIAKLALEREPVLVACLPLLKRCWETSCLRCPHTRRLGAYRLMLTWCAG